MNKSFLLHIFLLVLPHCALSQVATRLRVDYIENSIAIDSTNPRFSWALEHPQRAQAQTAYQIIVTSVKDGVTTWNTGKVQSNRTLNIPYGGLPLESDSDYSWSVSYWDSNGAPSVTVASSNFSTALLTPSSWMSAQWITSPFNGSLNTYRAEFNVSSPVARARLYISGLGYHKSWINGKLTDDHELGTFTTFQKRVLYNVVDVTDQIQEGCNALGVMLGHGWFNQPSVNVGNRQLIALLSVTTTDGLTSYYPSTVAGATFMDSTSSFSVFPLLFAATSGPVIEDDIYLGEVFDGRIAASIDGWSQCLFGNSSAWVPIEKAAVSPATFGSIMESWKLMISTDKDYVVQQIISPSLGEFTYDFGQNMAGQITLTVSDCPAGTVITVSQAEMIFINGSINNIYQNSPMKATYTCSGVGVETYRTLFTYFGFRYSQILGFPGTPDETSLVAHYVHSNVPDAGEFVSSNSQLNAIQHATRYSLGSNMMDVPTDCSQRERRGWLKDAALVTETSFFNFDSAVFHGKWLKDIVDAQEFSNLTMGGLGAVPECVPYYSHGHVESDAGWAYSVWEISTVYANYYDDEAFEVSFYNTTLKWYMNHWIDIADAHGGVLPLAWYGDWMQYYPGPWNSLSIDYAQFFYISALDRTAEWATRLGLDADAARFANISLAARSIYMKLYFNESTYCFTDCHYVSQLFAIKLGLFPQGSPEEAAIWANAVKWWTAAQFPQHFGGGIISLAIVYPLLARFNMTDLGLRFQLQTTRPSLGQMIADGATTLWEGLDQTGSDGPGSKNHAMFGSSGAWYFYGLAGISRSLGSRSWSSIDFLPPTFTSGVLEDLTSASASVDTPMGRVASAWRASSNSGGTVCGTIYEEGKLTLSCDGGGVFRDVAFASFGTPIGDCISGLVSNITCDSANSTDVIRQLCIGQSSCTVWANASIFGDPCLGTRKSLAVALIGEKCANAEPVSPIYSYDIELPPNSVGTVRIPTPNDPSNALITEGGTTIWNGGFIPGVPGILMATASSDAVVFSIGSGSFAFNVFHSS
jgi:alpha-L-rhamnosidase